jgi:hypothetical protein
MKIGLLFSHGGYEAIRLIGIILFICGVSIMSLTVSLTGFFVGNFDAVSGGFYGSRALMTYVLAGFCMFLGASMFLAGSKLDDRVKYSKKRVLEFGRKNVEIYDLPSCTLVYGDPFDMGEGCTTVYSERSKNYFERLEANPKKPIVFLAAVGGYRDQLRDAEEIIDFEKKEIENAKSKKFLDSSREDMREKIKMYNEEATHIRESIDDYPLAQADAKLHELGHVDTLYKTGILKEIEKNPKRIEEYKTGFISLLEQHAIIYQFRGLLRYALRGYIPVSEAEERIKYTFFSYLEGLDKAIDDPHRIGLLRLFEVDNSRDTNIETVLKESPLAAKLYNLSSLPKEDIPGIMNALDKKDKETEHKIRKNSKL